MHSWSSCFQEIETNDFCDKMYLQLASQAESQKDWVWIAIIRFMNIACMREKHI